MERETMRCLEEIVGKENISTRPRETYVYASDASIHQHSPAVVVRVHKAEEVQAICRLANEQRIPIVPRGSGTSLSGNPVPVGGGIVLDMKPMNRILEINVDDLYVVVEPGVINDDLNSVLAEYGVFFPPTPASGKVATIGGMIGNNASGMRAGKYGATRDAVLGLKVVLADGSLIECGTRTLKNSSGYQLEKLFVGSEGTLGIVVEAILKISQLPQSRAAAVASFPSLESAGRGVSLIMARGLNPSALEIMDRVCISAVNKAMGMDLPECEAILLIEADGHPLVVEEDIEKIARACRDAGAVNVESTADEKEIERLWAGRKGVLPSLSRLSGGFVSTSLADDMDVPLSKVPETVKAFQDIAERNGIIVGTYGHAGTGNLHTKVLFDPTSREHWERAKRAVAEIYDVVLRVGGTVSGEHGIAISKARYMKKERKTALEAMRALKRALDPNNILNPYKIMDGGDDFLTATPLRYPVVRP